MSVSRGGIAQNSKGDEIAQNSYALRIENLNYRFLRFVTYGTVNMYVILSPGSVPVKTVR